MSLHVGARAGGLNNDPMTLRSEELALEECMRGIDVRRTWSEKELVHSFGGGICPGTPDGMFEDWSSALTCVQVVRVPLHDNMTPEEVEDTMYSTVLTKVVKSQNWMKSTQILPTNFVIFCWLPRSAAGCYANACGESCGARVEALTEQLRKEGWPFYVKLCVPADPGELFPAMFAFQYSGRAGRASDLRARKSCISEANLSTFDPTDFESENELVEWDIFAVSEQDNESEAHDLMDVDSFEDEVNDEVMARLDPEHLQDYVDAGVVPTADDHSEICDNLAVHPERVSQFRGLRSHPADMSMILEASVFLVFLILLLVLIFDQ